MVPRELAGLSRLDPVLVQCICVRFGAVGNIGFVELNGDAGGCHAVEVRGVLLDEMRSCLVDCVLASGCNQEGEWY